MNNRLSFTSQNKGIASRLISNIELYSPLQQNAQKINAIALWDTGASISAITPKIMKQLCLVPADKIIVEGAHGRDSVFTTFISVMLPNKLFLSDHRVAVCNFSQILDMLIGMDIITLGDFAVCNGFNQTQFSFVTPPLQEKINFETRK